MKKLLLTACVVACAGSVFAQGTVYFITGLTGTYVTHIYNNPAVTAQVRGMGSADNPAGATDWSGYTSIAGSGYSAALMSIPSGDPTLNPVWASATTTFRTGTTAGRVAPITVTLGNVAADAASAALTVFAWDNKAGTITDPTAAWAAWAAGTIAGGTSAKITLSAIGGGTTGLNTPPNLYASGELTSFNIYIVPEPTTMALAGLGAAALLIFRRRK